MMINSPMAITEEAGSVFALEAQDNTLYAVCAYGLFISHDDGASWQPIALGDYENAALMSIAIAPNRLFIGTLGAVLHSADAGASWQITGLAVPPPLVTAICVSPAFAEDGIVLAATAEDGIFVSCDKGVNWTAWNFGLLDCNVNALLISPGFARDNTVFAGTDSGIFISTDGGRKWRAVPFPMAAAPVLSLAIAQNRLFAGTEEQGLWVSEDSGASWQPILDENCTGTIHALHTNGAKIWLLADDKLVQSSDGGNTWYKMSDLLPDQSALSLLLHGDKALVGFAEGAILQVQL